VNGLLNVVSLLVAIGLMFHGALAKLAARLRPLRGILSFAAASAWFMQCRCNNPCAKYRADQLAINDGWNISGGIVCCGGVQFICTWGADKETNPKAKATAERCLQAHERTHLNSMRCSGSDYGPITRPGFNPSVTPEQHYLEEMHAYSLAKACFQNALSECGTDQQCIDSVKSWIQHEQDGYNVNESLYNQL
jgi:hypothetical protein